MYLSSAAIVSGQPDSYRVEVALMILAQHEPNQMQSKHCVTCLTRTDQTVAMLCVNTSSKIVSRPALTATPCRLSPAHPAPFIYIVQLSQQPADMSEPLHQLLLRQGSILAPQLIPAVLAFDCVQSLSMHCCVFLVPCWC